MPAITVEDTAIDGFPTSDVGHLSEPPQTPWAWHPDDLAALAPTEPTR